MATHTVAPNMARLIAGQVLDPGLKHGAVRCFIDSFGFAGQAIGSTIRVATLPRGARFLYGISSGSVPTGAGGTIAIGSAIAPGVASVPEKYRAAAAHTNLGAALFGVHAMVGARLELAEDVIVTVGGAVLPASGSLTVIVFYTFD